MLTTPIIPTLEEVKRIASLEDPVIRNLQITQCYHELSRVLAARTSLAANWCTFATWASKQAGQTIRKEDLARLLESRLRSSPSAVEAAGSIATSAGLSSANLFESHPEMAFNTPHFTPALERASDAVSRGNQKVFEEIGYEFARFYHTCLAGEALDHEKLSGFCEGLRKGEPPDGQTYLCQAFTHYSQALTETENTTHAQLILLANLKIGLHEQIRLQPEIAESLDAGLVSSLEFTRLLFASIFPFSGWFNLAHLYLRRLLGRPTALDLAIRALLAAARIHLRQVITETMMMITLPSGVRLSLHRDLVAGFPDSLQHITNSDLQLLLEKYDPTPDSPVDSGALDWADLPDRLHFIIDLFRCYQENKELHAPPFTTEQIEDLKAGRRPAGRL